MMSWSPLVLSLETAVCATVLTFFLGIGLAYWVLRLPHGQSMADALITLPLVLPPTVVGFFLLAHFRQTQFYRRYPRQGRFFLVFTWEAAVIASFIVSLPLMYRTARGAFEQLDGTIVAAARTLGISEWRIFWHILLPNAKSGIIAGLVLAFTRALGEFGANPFRGQYSG